MLTLTSVLVSGGATVDAETLDSVTLTSGYGVSLPWFERRIPNDTFAPVEFVRVLSGISDLVLAINASTKPGVAPFYVGIWVDNNEIVFDVTYRIHLRANALDFGTLFQQQAIYDYAANEAIPL